MKLLNQENNKDFTVLNNPKKFIQKKNHFKTLESPLIPLKSKEKMLENTMKTKLKKCINKLVND